MSFSSLLAGVGEDPQVALEIALALIDGCGSSSSSSSGSYSADESDAKSADTGSQGDTSGPAKAKRKRSNAEHVARHRERKKAEVVHLRTQIGELEATLAQMQSRQLNRGEALDFLLEKQRARLAASAASAESGVLARVPQLSVWLDVAASQARKRHKSEVLNAKLKEETARQLKVIKALEEILGEKAVVHGLDLLLEKQQQEVQWSRLLAQEDRVFQDLSSGLKQMYFTVDSLFEPRLWPNAPEAVSCTTRLKSDAATGSFVEVQTCTPLRVEFRKTGQASWDRLCDYSVGFDANYCVKRLDINDTSFQKCYTMIINGPDGQPLELRGVSFVEMVEEDARMVWMWRSLILTSDNNGPRFLEKGWTISESASNLATSPSKSAAPPTSVFRTCYQVSCDSPGSKSAHDPQTSYLIESVLRALSSRIRLHQQSQQQALLEQYARRRLQLQQLQQQSRVVQVE